MKFITKVKILVVARLFFILSHAAIMALTPRGLCTIRRSFSFHLLNRSNGVRIWKGGYILYSANLWFSASSRNIILISRTFLEFSSCSNGSSTWSILCARAAVLVWWGEGGAELCRARPTIACIGNRFACGAVEREQPGWKYKLRPAI